MVRTLCASARALVGGEEGKKEALTWAREGENEEDEEAVSLAVTVHLLLNPPATSAAASLVSSAKYQDFAADSAFSQITKARLDLFTGPADSYQSAYYGFEEAGQSSGSKCGRAIAQAAQGRWVEAEQALTIGDDATADQLANAIAIGLPSGKKLEDVEKLFEKLKTVQPSHALLQDFEEKSKLFDAAAARYGSAVEV
ncbi:hypothetical protein BT69DRAFT_1284509 [Atractiella rhizophila]|nr:hypothetical protein BT69DRAFT_1284509 [Atractiella rhizophila]